MLPPGGSFRFVEHGSAEIGCSWRCYKPFRAMNAMKPAKIIKNTSLIGTPVVFPPELAMPPAMAEARVSEIPMAEAVVEPAD